MILLITPFLTAGLAACASHSAGAVRSPHAPITYLGAAAVKDMTLGRFQISSKKHGSYSCHSQVWTVSCTRAATTEIRGADERGWRLFNAVLEEVEPSAARLVVAPDKVGNFLYQGEGPHGRCGARRADAVDRRARSSGLRASLVALRSRAGLTGKCN